MSPLFRSTSAVNVLANHLLEHRLLAPARIVITVGGDFKRNMGFAGGNQLR
ncbi:hypothetical protein NDR87_31235 [Nocardia sp. CDC159]|uniref:Uncharacterized protein n=1 Tax=Nocardia pulmonis TaxID=2951408 RepID=A0A9X2EEH8_9NOCA|nr:MULTISPECIES: hypothetical protein [Nocardia]MCM6777975.1 hypothetical protein [Nocardia pulmonis]MCM6790854.1 hypothetical protein [Nocardia sp. CDC159]